MKSESERHEDCANKGELMIIDDTSILATMDRIPCKDIIAVIINLINIKFVSVVVRLKTPKNVNATLLSEIKILYHRITALETNNFVSFPLFLFAK